MRSLALALLLLPLAGTTESLAWVIDTRTADYLEDARDRRRVAAVVAQLVRIGTDLRLRVGVSALGPAVEPVPGLEGVPGTNLRTAMELQRLLADGELACVVSRDGIRIGGGRLWRVHRASLATRRVEADGTFDLDARTASLPTQVVFESDALGSGRSDVDLTVRGLPRLRATVEAADGRGRIVALASVAELPQ